MSEDDVILDDEALARITANVSLGYWEGDMVRMKDGRTGKVLALYASQWCASGVMAVVDGIGEMDSGWFEKI